MSMQRADFSYVTQLAAMKVRVAISRACALKKSASDSPRILSATFKMFSNVLQYCAVGMIGETFTTVFRQIGQHCSSKSAMLLM